MKNSEETVQVRKRIRNICSYGNMLTNENDYHSEKSLQGRWGLKSSHSYPTEKKWLVIWLDSQLSLYIVEVIFFNFKIFFLEKMEGILPCYFYWRKIKNQNSYMFLKIFWIFLRIFKVLLSIFFEIYTTGFNPH